MADRLSPSAKPHNKPHKLPQAWRWALLLWILPVLLLHVWLADALHGLGPSRREVAPMPPRLTVAFVRELKQSAPAAVPKPARSVQPTVGRPAIALPVAEPEPAASEPDSVEPAEPAAPASAALETLDASLAQAQPVPIAEPTAVLPPEPPEPGPEWPLSTQLRYALTGNYRGAVTGQAQVEWIRQGRHYQVHLDLSIGPSFAPLMSRRISSDGLLGPAGIAPQRFDEDTRILFSSRRRATVLFQGDQLTLANGAMEAATAGTQDAVSQFVQLTWLFLTGREPLFAGHVVALPLALPRRQYDWRYQVVGEETLQTALGPLATWHLVPLQKAVGGDLASEVWLAPSLQYLPVRFLIRQDERTFVDLMLKSAPLQSAP
ncbi:DUF3108 domain-containing protein [Roseateles sp. GG27B]